MGGDTLSPVIHLRLAEPQEDANNRLTAVANHCTELGVAIVTAKFLSDEMCAPPTR